MQDFRLRILGERVAVERVDETYKTKLIIPEAVNLTRMIGKVVAVGDGKVKFHNGDRKVMKMVVREDDLILFQMNSIQEANAQFYDPKKKPMYILNQGDCIARLKSTTISVDDVEMLGCWCLVDPYIDKPESGILIPDTVDPVYSGMPRFKLLKKSADFDIPDIEVGQELVCEKALVNRIDLNGKAYGFLDTARIYGVIS